MIGILRAWADDPNVIHTESKHTKRVHKYSPKGWVTTVDRSKYGVSNKGKSS